MKSCPLIIDNPELILEWDYLKNEKNGILPDQLTCGSNKRAWWICKNKHSWNAVIVSRYRGGHGCPYCSGRLPIEGKTDLATVSPLLAQEWNYKRNGCLRPEMFTIHSGKTVWWKCSKGHEWEARISHRQNGSGCPYCSGRNVIKGVSDLATLYPSIAAEWDYSQNGELSPELVKPMSSKRVFWRCPNGHIYISDIAHRVSGGGCPYCSNHKLLKGFNDLATVRPELTAEWDYDNNSFLPSEVVFGSGRRFNWICKKGHRYSATIDSRNRGRGCPFCANKKVLKGYNDLATVFPDIAIEWNYEKNAHITPQSIVYGSGTRVWWKCNKGHEWMVPVVNRTRDGNGCPICNKARSTSFPEKALLYYIKKSFPNAVSNYRNITIHNREIDVYLSEYRIGVEYDGDIWHRDSVRDN